jgi:hypothetical protein
LIETLLNVCFYALIVAVWRVLIPSAGLEAPFKSLVRMRRLGGVLRARGHHSADHEKEGRPLNCSELRVLKSQSVLG